MIQHYDAHAASVTCISFHPDGNYLVSSSMDSTMKIWDLKMGQILYTLYGHEVNSINIRDQSQQLTSHQMEISSRQAEQMGS